MEKKIRFLDFFPPRVLKGNIGPWKRFKHKPKARSALMAHRASSARAGYNTDCTRKIVSLFF